MTLLSRPLVVLGATGSIGRRTLEIARRLGLEVVGIAARTPGPELVELANAHPTSRVVATGGSRDEREALRRAVGDRVGFGMDSLLELAASPDTTVVNGIVGATGLEASVTALTAGNRLGLANKESLVAGGPVIRRVLDSGRGELIPIDSEHSALFQLLSEVPAGHVDRLILTASGGPFRGRRREELEEVTVEEALRHPTWEMGRRITIDSATLANKGLEVIEAHYLFDVAYDRIEVLVHPQSIVHSLVRLVDGSLLAHLGIPDMRIPIQYALTYPDRRKVPLEPLDLTVGRLTFEPPDTEAFPALALAYEAGRRGGGSPAVYNAADEVAVEAFLTGRLGFCGIPEVIERTLDAVDAPEPKTVEEVLEIDRAAREAAASYIGGHC